MMLVFAAYYPGAVGWSENRGMPVVLGGHNLTNKCAKFQWHFASLKMHCTHAHRKFQPKLIRTRTSQLATAHRNLLSHIASHALLIVIPYSKKTRLNVLRSKFSVEGKYIFIRKKKHFLNFLLPLYLVCIL